jgi:DNA primase
MDLFNFIKSNTSMLDVAQEYTTCKKTGSTYWKGRCPFHHEKTASFTVSPDKGIFYCFGCHQGGDTIAFIAKIENCTQLQAAQFLAEKYNLQVPESVQMSKKGPQDKDIYELHQCIAQWCHKQLANQKNVIQYLMNRGFTEKQIKYFSIGYFPGSSYAVQSLLTEARKLGFIAQDFIEAKFFVEGKASLYSSFQDRIMFPIKNHFGKVCGFGGRIYSANSQRPKYYNSKEGVVFHKGKILFGLHAAKQSIKNENSVYLVEGYTDCIAMHELGYTNTVATLGTACTMEHLKVLARYTQYIYLMYDGDAAGQKAILRITELCWKLNLELQVIQLPKTKDPASFLESKEDIAPFLQKKQDIFNFFLQNTGKDFTQQTMKEKVGVASQILNLVFHVESPIKQNILLLNASQILQIPLEILKQEYSQQNNGDTSTHTANKQKKLTLEQQILVSLVSHPEEITDEHKMLLQAGFPQKIQQIIDRTIRSGNPTRETVENNLSEEEKIYIQELSISENFAPSPSLFKQLMQQFHKKHWKSIVSHIKMKITQASLEKNNAEIERLLKQFHSLKNKLIKK